ncbi:MAG: Uma2 family endonuclease [Jaaginema sp. PMC 1079.18]|nr:Uma2 family endonuclease [Jaaginema sp. PMC 1080.18]MEC4852814.1 Uma2 family endonuclease [Jaaginema sp. PMC 1079.18]MEC4866258.1 Uma2 family endonuclease [Jaaginema sp. PMC 1078.18]
MIANPHSTFITPEQYRQLEATSDIKHEYRNGEVYAMAGTTDTHNTIALNLAILIRSHLRGSNCRVYFADIQARLEECNCFYYPDLMVTCDSRDTETSIYKRYPKLIIEVLSNSTEAFDRGDKFIDYQSLDSLQEYVLISTQQQRVDCYRRSDRRQWLFEFFAPNQVNFHLSSIDLEVSFAALYEDVVL